MGWLGLVDNTSNTELSTNLILRARGFLPKQVFQEQCMVNPLHLGLF